MNVILGRAESLLPRTDDPGLKKGLQSIVNQAEQIVHLMNQLLAFGGQHPVTFQPVDLRHTVEEVLAGFEKQLARQRIRVEKAWDSSLPFIKGDPGQLRQALWNVIQNAVQAMPDGGTLRIGIEPIERWIRLWVRDEGCGMSPDHLSRAFDPFFTVQQDGKAKGLGLPVVYGIVKSHKGAVLLNSQPGQGTTCTMFLPQDPEASTGPL